MGTRRIRSFLWLIAGLFVTATVFACLYGLVWSPVTLATAPSQPRSMSLSTTQPSYALTIADFQPLWNLQLRQPLFDPPPAPSPAPPVVKQPILTIKLAGIINEPGHCFAMFTMPDGQIEMKAVGDRCGDAEVVSIEDNVVNVRFNGQTIKLRLQEG